MFSYRTQIRSNSFQKKENRLRSARLYQFASLVLCTHLSAEFHMAFSLSENYILNKLRRPINQLKTRKSTNFVPFGFCWLRQEKPHQLLMTLF